MNPFFVTDFSISDSLKTVRKSVLIYETIIPDISNLATGFSVTSHLSDKSKRQITLLSLKSTPPVWVA